MKKHLSFLFWLLLLATPSLAQGQVPGNFSRVTVSGLPSAADAKFKTYVVTDASTTSDCTVGSGSLRILCTSDGSTWTSNTADYVPKTTTVNGHVLNTNVTVTADDVLPSQTGNSGKFLTTNGTTASWGAGGGGSSTWNGITDPTGNQSLDMGTNLTTWTANTAITNTTNTLLTIGHNTSGTAAAGFGTRTLYKLEDSTTADISAAAVDVVWATATHGSTLPAYVITLDNGGSLFEVARFNWGSGNTRKLSFTSSGEIETVGGLFVSVAGRVQAFKFDAISTFGQITAPDSGKVGIDAYLGVNRGASITGQLDVLSGSASRVAAIFSSAASPSTSIAAFQINSTADSAVNISEKSSIDIFNGTAPTASVTNGVRLYAEDVSSSSELKTRDEAGNVTVLSPHDFSKIPGGASEPMAWAFYSERDGTYINVDMLRLARLVERLSGEKLVYIGKK